jgi:hypothetical protein
MPGSLAFALGRLVRMGRSRRVRILTRLARTLGRFDRVRVVPVFGGELSIGLLLLLDHARDPSALLPGNDLTGSRQG